MTTELVRYDAMLYAIAECHRVDEVKDLHDKALALELYARQAKNSDAERKACDVRLRAERRAGELLKEMAESGQRATGRPEKESQPAILSDLGISATQSSRWQKLADVPKAEFDAALQDPSRKPSTTRIINEARDPQPTMATDTLWIWGRARDFEREGYANKNPEQLLAGMTETMRADMERIVPSMLIFFELFQEVLTYERA